jgi:ribonuclease P protein component
VTFRPAEHIRRRAEFEAIYESGAKVHGRFMTMFVRRTTGPHPRLGLAATRKIGGAVIRNRAKRLARELFRHHKPAESLDIVVVPRREFLDASYDSLEREFGALLERAGQGRGARKPGPRPPGAAAPRRARGPGRHSGV